MKINPTAQFSILISLLFILVFTKLGQHPIEAWDEARNGVSAIEMLQNNDWINPHYKGEPDSWVAKPPLAIWGIAGSFSLFGFTEFALRLPSAIAIILAFFFIFKIIRLYKNRDFAFYTLLILMSINGLIGWHVGRTGDTDALLICCLMGGLYHFLRYLDFGKNKAIYWTGLFWGIAFMEKGPAMGVLLPGLLLFVLFTKRLNSILQTKNVWIGIAIAAIFPISWFFIIQMYGVTFADNSAGDNVVDRLFIYDLVVRFTENRAGLKPAFSPDFFFYSLDKLFNIWNYLFFGFLGTGLFLFIKNRKKWSSYLLAKEQRILLLSLCLYFPLAFFLTLAAKSNSWYLAPVIPFVGIVTYFGIDILKQKNKFVLPIFIGLLCFTIGRKLHEFYTPKEKPTIISNHIKTLTNAKNIAVLGIIEQDILLYNYFANQQIFYPKSKAELQQSDLIFLNKDELKNLNKVQFSTIAESEKYLILKRKE